MGPVAFATRHARIVGALMMREIITRFGREGLGFLWLVGEPLLFCLGVIVMWTLIKPEYEHGVRVGPFVMTGYMALLLIRHQIGYSQGAVQGNIGLLFHRQISVLHLYVARNGLEFLGATAAFVVVYIGLLVIGQVKFPHDLGLLYLGWIVLAFMSSGLAMVLSALSIRNQVMERLVPLISYILIPISGAFFMVSWLPDRYQEAYLLFPIPHGVEMIRAGVFGEFVETHYDVWYAIAWACGFNFLGMLLLAGARDRVDIE